MGLAWLGFGPTPVGSPMPLYFDLQATGLRVELLRVLGGAAHLSHDQARHFCALVVAVPVCALWGIAPRGTGESIPRPIQRRAGADRQRDGRRRGVGTLPLAPIFADHRRPSRSIEKSAARHLLSVVLGVSTVLALWGVHGLAWIAAPALVADLVGRAAPRRLAVPIGWVVFGALLVRFAVELSRAGGDSLSSRFHQLGVIDPATGMMTMALRAVALGHARANAARRADDEASARKATNSIKACDLPADWPPGELAGTTWPKRRLTAQPTALEAASYLLGGPSLLVGPAVPPEDWLDWVTGSGLYDPALGAWPGRWREMGRVLGTAACLAGTHLLALSGRFPAVLPPSAASAVGMAVSPVLVAAGLGAGAGAKLASALGQGWSFPRLVETRIVSEFPAASRAAARAAGGSVWFEYANGAPDHISRFVWMVCVLWFGVWARYWLVWKLSEAALLAAGVGRSSTSRGLECGARGWTGAANVRLGSLIWPTGGLLDFAASWNLRTAMWMHRFVYSQLPQNLPWLGATARVAVTQAVSVIWHGPDAGYWVCLMGATPYLNASRALVRAERDARRTAGHYVHCLEGVNDNDDEVAREAAQRRLRPSSGPPGGRAPWGAAATALRCVNVFIAYVWATQLGIPFKLSTLSNWVITLRYTQGWAWWLALPFATVLAPRWQRWALDNRPSRPLRSGAATEAGGKIKGA